MNEKDRAYKEKFMKFAIRMVNLKKYLNEQKREFNMADQIQRSGTAIGAIQREATFAESDSDMIHKLRIALKEAGETQYWLEILCRTKYINNKEYDELKNDCSELIRMLTSSINTIRRRLEK